LATVSAYIVKAAEQYAPAVANVPIPKQVPVSANPDGKVVQLTPSTYESKVAGSTQQWFIQMYAPWCSYCNELSSTWTQLAASLKGQVNVASLNCEGSKGL
jgi:thioredoxin-like negative regulator of GroEL